MRRELTGWVQRPACSHRLSAASRVKRFWNFCESRTANDAEKRRSAQGTAVTPSLLDFDSNQPCGSLPRHESAGPAVSGIKKLLVTPKHPQMRSRSFLPLNLVINVAFPRRRLTGHQVEIERCRPGENAVTRADESLITWRRRSSETLG